MSLKGVYERQAGWFDAHRDKSLFERGWLERFCAELPEGARVLDLGCGTGEPVAAWLIGRGCAVTGMDFAAPMLAMARARFPAARWIEGDMRALDLGEAFDGVLGWDSFFHLTPEEQREVLPRMARHLAPGGALMLTVGPEAGEAWGEVGGEPVYHASLSRGEYEAVLGREGLQMLDFVAADPGCGGRSVLLAKKG